MTSLINSILTNTTAIAVRNNLNSSNNSLAKSIERLSSGFKINCAKDGATECAISTKTNIQLSGLNTANQNAMQGINMLNVAEDALENMSEKTMRIRDLVLKTLNSTYSDDELDAIQNEINQLSEEIKREKETTVYNKKKIFDTAIEKTQEVKPVEKPYLYEVEYISYPSASTANQYCITLGSFADYDAIDFTFSSKDTSNKDVLLGKNYSTGFIAYDTAEKITMGYDPNPSTGNLSVSENITPAQKGDGTKRTLHFEYDFSEYPKSVLAIGGYSKSAFTKEKEIYQITCYKDDKIVRDFIPVVDKNNQVCMYDKITGEFFYNEGSLNFATGSALPEEKPKEITIKNDNFTTLQIGQEAGKDNKIDIELGFDLNSFELDVKSRSGAKEAIQKCDELIKMFSHKRSKIGSSINRINSVCDLQNINKENLSQIKSLTIDTDTAQEATNFTQMQILKEISVSLFTQANKITSNLALTLLIQK